jgi:hypothetical protein
MFQYLQLINKNTALSSGSLKQFNDQMEQLTKTAADSGVAMSVVSQNLRGLFSANTEAGIGQNALGLSFAQASNQAQLGPGFVNQTPTLTGPEGAAGQYILAGYMSNQAGTTITQGNIASMLKTPAGAVQVQASSSAQFISMMKNMMPPSSFAWLQDRVKQRQQEMEQDPSTTSSQISQEFWQTPSLSSTIDRQALLAMANQFGPDGAKFGSPEEATMRLVVELGGLGDARTTAEQAVQSGEFNTSTGKSKVAGMGGVSAADNVQALKDLKSGGEATDAYKAMVAKTGTGSGIITETLRKLSSDEQKDEKWQVSTGGGGYRVVSTKDLVTKFQGQAESGEARRVGDGKSFSDITGYGSDTSKSAMRKAKKEEGYAEKYGEDYDKYKKEHPEEFKKDGGGVTGLKGVIDLSPDAKKWFRLQDTGRHKTEPPDNTNVTGGPGSGTWGPAYGGAR